MGRHLPSEICPSEDLAEPESDSGSLALIHVLNHEAALPLGAWGETGLHLYSGCHLTRAGTEACLGDGVCSSFS